METNPSCSSTCSSVHELKWGVPKSIWFQRTVLMINSKSNLAPITVSPEFALWIYLNNRKLLRIENRICVVKSYRFDDGWQMISPYRRRHKFNNCIHHELRGTKRDRTTFQLHLTAIKPTTFMVNTLKPQMKFDYGIIVHQQNE